MSLASPLSPQVQVKGLCSSAPTSLLLKKQAQIEHPGLALGTPGWPTKGPSRATGIRARRGCRLRRGARAAASDKARCLGGQAPEVGDGTT